jgi:hypothetical protein
MPRENQSLYALNRGVVSRLGLARIDVKRLAIAAQDQTNWVPRVLGGMSLRAGRTYIGATLANAAARFLKFIFATTDTALIELTASAMRIWIADVLLTRPAVTTSITNGTFAGSIAGWTDLDDAGAVSSWVAPNYMQLVGSGPGFAIREQQVTVAGANINVEHGIRITIVRGPVTLRIGSTSGGDDYVRETVLNEGSHSISVVPTGDFYIRFMSRQLAKAWVSNCTIEAAGAVVLPTPWGASSLSYVRIDQSADVVFVACVGLRPRRIERRGTHPSARSWSVSLYAPNDGPFKLMNVTPTTLAPSAINGNITLTSSTPIFKPTHVGALFSLTSSGQFVELIASTSGVSTGSIRVTGVGGARPFQLIIIGNFSGSQIDLQSSSDNVNWSNLGAPHIYTVDANIVLDDSLDNQTVYYRLFLTNRVAPDNITMRLYIGAGSVRGMMRITDYNTSTSVGAEVLVSLGGTTASSNWQEGQWSDLRGWPTSCRLHEGRLWWFGQNGVWGSISDAFDSFDETFPGNGGPINRAIGSGPVDVINWGLSLKGLVMGAEGAEFSARASSLDEPLTPTNFNVKGSSTQGSGPVDAIKVDQSGYYVNRSGVKVFDISFEPGSYDYSSVDVFTLAPEVGSPGIIRMDVQRTPDTRLHCVKSDGTVIMAVTNKSEDVLALIPITTNGAIEDVVVLPALTGNQDDQVYYVVRRTINGATVRYLEKWAQEADCRGDRQLCFLADSCISYSGAATNRIPVPHLEGESVVVWADGVDVGTDDTQWPWTQRYRVTGGAVTLAVAASNVVVGLGYTGRFKTAKLGQAFQGSSPLNKQKLTKQIGFIAADLPPKGVRFGSQFDSATYTMDNLPEIEQGTVVGPGTRADYDEDMIAFPGEWSTDSRICLQAQAPRPATVLAITLDSVR